jgi:hypothetical protein
MVTPEGLIHVLDNMASLDTQIPPADVEILLDALGNGATIEDVEDSASNWDAEIDDIFSTPKPEPKKSSSSGSITCHRLLISEEVLSGKRERPTTKENGEKKKTSK